ncbi:MAG: FAD-binding oxidoreductase [Fulvivirga sp.]
MQKSKVYDYIIVGQGLAGSALSYQLIKARKKVLVIDDDRPITSSKVAAGLYNPVTGRKMVKTWKADLLFPYLITFYKELEQVCSAKFLVEMPIYRPFISYEEQNEWMGKSASDEFTPYIKAIHRHRLYSFSNDAYGGLELARSGYLQVRSFLSAYRAYLKSITAIEIEKFNPLDLVLNQEYVSYKTYRASRIIFCDGLGAMENAFFDWIPFHPVKGEILLIETDMPLKGILNRGVFVIPVDEDTFRVGSNYDNNDMTTEITSKAREEIIRRLNELVNVPYNIVKQEAGIRPAIKDRRPILGLHPHYKTIGVLNGLGAKGVSLAPYFSKHFVEFLENGKELLPEVNINRYFSLYYDSVKGQ